LAYRTEKQFLSNSKTLFCRGQSNVLKDLSGNLVIILHGFNSSKEDHTYQAMHLTSLGMHSLSLQLPNKGPWVSNGRTLVKIVQFIYRWPEIFDNHVAVSKIVLLGHSFGGAAVAVALAEGAPATGAILLDPAAISRELPAYLSRIKRPMLILGADEHVSPARNLDYC
jgi:pimeloyl-ACP methyl ester carboxylesterase